MLYTIFKLKNIFSTEKGSPPEMPPGTYYKPKFFDFMLEEYYACRESVGIIDMSSFSKMKIQVLFNNYYLHSYTTYTR